VGEGAVVGQVGPSGEAEHPVPYVHLGVRRTAEADGYLDPLGFLPPRAPDKAPAAPATEPAPAQAPASAPKAGSAAPPETQHAAAAPSSKDRPHRDARVTTRSGRSDVVAAPAAARHVTARDAAAARPPVDPSAPSSAGQMAPDSFEIPSPEAPASAVAPSGESHRSGHGAGSQAIPTRVVLLAGGVCTALLAAVWIAAVRRRRADGSSPETAGTPSPVPEPAPASAPDAISSQPSARLPRAASPRCAARGGPHRSPRRRAELAPTS
jgi:hypothetical protein